MLDKAIISDWGSTLFPSDDVTKKLCYAVLSDSAKQVFLKGKIWELLDFAKLLRVDIELYKKIQQYKDGKRHLREVWEPLNSYFLQGRPVAFIDSVIDEFARESAHKIDGRVVRPIRAVHPDYKTGILSSSYGYSIERILEEAGYSDVFDHIVASRIEKDGDRAIGFTLEIYERKPEIMEEVFFRKHGFRPEGTYYLGNDLKDDSPVADILPGGNFIVPFNVSDGKKETFASKYRAFVPENEKDLLDYLQKS